MVDSVYQALATVLDHLPNGYPHTATDVEIRILQKIFTPAEAVLACHLTGTPEPVDVIAARANLSVSDTSKQLFQMARGGKVWLEKGGSKAGFRLAPFVVGIYEAQVDQMDHELAHLMEEYFASQAASGYMSIQPSIQRVVPAQGAVKTEWVLPYDDVRSILLKSKTFNVIDCICRLQQAQLDHPCKFPTHVCLNFSDRERGPRPGDISQQEALELLDRCEEVGLVHTVSNVMTGVGYVCNCCGCCCGILRGITTWGVADSVAYANYYAVIDPQFCANCGNCIERCQVQAITEGESCSVVDRVRCIGCGLCVTGCPNDAVHLELKPEAEQIHPPQQFSEWEHQRLHNRGLED